MHVLCLDLEGVLIPEIWIRLAEHAGIPELKRTTRDEPDYDRLMRFRLEILEREEIRLSDITEVIDGMEPLPGAIDFVRWARSRTRLIILSDTFEEFAHPLMRQLDFPTLFCHRLEVCPEGRITNYRLRQEDQKRKAIQAFQGLNFKVAAGGDSYNDLTMLKAADHGVFFRPPETLSKEYPAMGEVHDHPSLQVHLERVLASWEKPSSR